MSRRLRVIGAIVAVTGLAATAFYGSMSLAARRGADLAGAPPSARNSIQHAYAAAEVYAWLRVLQIPATTSADLTRHLGYANEWVERFVKWPGDTTREVYKDLVNNQLGIVAANAEERCLPDKRRHRLTLIGQLARDQNLIWRNSDTRVPSLPDGLDVSAAIAAFERDRPAIEAAVLSLKSCS